MKLRFKLMLLICMTYLATNFYAQIPLVYNEENRGANYPKPPLPVPQDLDFYPLLPDPFEFSDGSGRVEDYSDWSRRRNEIKAELEEYEIGPKPIGPDDITADFGDGVLTVVITENGESLTLTSNVVIPDGEGPFPVVIGMNSGTGSIPAALFAGVIQIPFTPGQIAPTHSGRDSNAPYFKLYPELTHVGYYSAWSWGISRLIDGIELIQSEINADLDRIAVSGCSYAGKMALFAGAFDERIALTFAQESGGGGVNSWRVAESLERNVEKIDNTDYTWFMQSMQTNFRGQPGLLPHDHHELMAMIAPRALFVMGNPGWEWLGDEAGYVSSVAAGKVYESFGIDDRFGYSFRGTSNHCATNAQLDLEIKAFIDKFLHGDEDANTDIRIAGNFIEFVNPDFWINWPVNPDAPSVSISLSEAGTTFESPVSYTITATITAAVNNLEKVIFYNANEVIGEITTEPFELILNDVSPGAYTYFVEAIDVDGLKGFSNVLNITVQASSVDVYKTSTPPIIDGKIDDVWTKYEVVMMNAENVLVGSSFTEEQLSGYAKMLWDDDFVYLLAVVTDAVLINDGPNIYDDDNVEFYFDANNSKGTTYDSDDVQYSFRWNDGTNIGSIPANYSKEGIEYVILDTEVGYNVEVKIPWTTIQGLPEGGKVIGFDFMINDDDTGGSRDRKLSWNATADQAWQNPSYFGTVILRDDVVLVSVNDPIKTNLVSIHPNPVEKSLFVEGIAGAFKFYVYDLNGRLYLEGKTEHAISVDSLTKGSYVINIVSASGTNVLKFFKQ